MQHAAVADPRGDDRKTVAFACVFRARTEQLYVAGGSTIDGRDPAGQQLDLGMADRPSERFSRVTLRIGGQSPGRRAARRPAQPPNQRSTSTLARRELRWSPPDTVSPLPPTGLGRPKLGAWRTSRCSRRRRKQLRPAAGLGALRSRNDTKMEGVYWALVNTCCIFAER